MKKIRQSHLSNEDVESKVDHLGFAQSMGGVDLFHQKMCVQDDSEPKRVILG